MAAFAESFARGHELGAACCVRHRGETVVDRWGVMRVKASGLAQKGDDRLVRCHAECRGVLEASHS